MVGVTLQERLGIERIERAIVDGDDVSPEDFATVTEHFERYVDLREQETTWPILSPLAFVESLLPIDATKYLQTWAAWNNKAFVSVEDLCAEAKAQLGKKYFDGRSVSQAPPYGLRIAEILILTGALKPEQEAPAKALQRDILDKAGARIFLGILLVACNDITLGEYYQAMAFHFGVSFSGVNDETVRAIQRERVREQS